MRLSWPKVFLVFGDLIFLSGGKDVEGPGASARGRCYMLG